MINSRLLIVSLTVFSALSFSAESFGSAGTGDGGWKASPELADALMKRRSETNYYEQKVPKYTLPDPLVMSDGTNVTDARTWRTRRRPEVLELFRTHVYGRSPVGRPKNMVFKVFDLERKALAGLAIRKQVAVNFTGKKDGPGMNILI
ncbi:MAG: acetylxylan esterase, partial [Planctomycetota bacterium]